MTSTRRWLALACISLWAHGCSSREESFPAVYPVAGSVVMENGAPLRGGALQFRPDSNADVTVVGDIDNDGKFRLRTIKGSKSVEGAPAGSYEVSIYPPLGKDRKPLYAPVVVPTKYQIATEQNQLEIRAAESQ